MRELLDSRVMIRLRLALLGLCCSGVVACVQRLPSSADMDRYYKIAEVQAQPRIADLERRRAEGKVDEYGYKRERDEIEHYISNRATTLAWTAHDLREKDLEAKGIPTPDHPQQISVPQAGSLPTGSDFRRFNQNELGATGSSTPINEMRQMMGDTQPGQNVRTATGEYAR